MIWTSKFGLITDSCGHWCRQKDDLLQEATSCRLHKYYMHECSQLTLWFLEQCKKYFLFCSVQINMGIAACSCVGYNPNEKNWNY